MSRTASTNQETPQRIGKWRFESRENRLVFAFLEMVDLDGSRSVGSCSPTCVRTSGQQGHHASKGEQTSDVLSFIDLRRREVSMQSFPADMAVKRHVV